MKAAQQTSRPLQIGLFGYGRMGQLVESAALNRGHLVPVKISNSLNVNASKLPQIDVCVDFSHPTAVLGHVRQACQHGKNIVIGTTGWESDREEIETLVEEHDIGILYAPNFSIGVHLFYQIVAEAQRLLSETFESAICEMHHSGKKDSPSGTAIELANILNVRPDTIASIRCGSIPGEHQVIFDNPENNITLTHTSRNRNAFAQGAVEAAEWLVGKKGWYSLDDILRR